MGRFCARRLFSSKDAQKFLEERGAGKGYWKLLLHNLSKSGKIFRIGKGQYTFNGANSPIDAALFPSYHGLQEALSIHGYWQQQANQILITPRKVRSGERDVLGRKVIVRRIARKMFFGFESINYGDEWINVSGPEKTLIDFYYFSEPLDKETLGKILEKIDRKTLAEYAAAMPKITRQKMEKGLGLKFKTA